jgi:predicted SprT family Zn-dependent metalloprotease
MELNSIREITLKLMKKHGVSDWTFKWGDFDVLGRCDYKQRQIMLSRIMTKHESNFNRIKNTILHEISHAIDYNRRGLSNHDNVWQEIARSIGCNAKKYGDSSGIDKEKFYKWIGTCPTCDNKYFFKVKPKNSRSCTKCDPKFNIDHKLDLQFNPRLKTWESFNLL